MFEGIDCCRPDQDLLPRLLSPDLADRGDADSVLVRQGPFSQRVYPDQEPTIKYLSKPFRVKPPRGTTLIRALNPGILGTYNKRGELTGLIDPLSLADEEELPVEPLEQGVRFLKRFGIETGAKTAEAFFADFDKVLKRLRQTLEAPLPEIGLLKLYPEFFDLNILFNYWQFRRQETGPVLRTLEKFLSADKIGGPGIYLFADPEPE